MNFFKKKTKQVKVEDFPPIGGLMVSKMIVDEHEKIHFMYREKRSRPEDSGWRLFSGLESDEYVDNPNNFGIYNPSTLIKIDPSIAEILLKAGVGSVFERKTDKSPWSKVTDYPLEDDYMVTHRLTEEWELEINNLFEWKQEEGENLFYTTGDKSLRLSVFGNEDKTKASLYEECRQTVAEANALKRFDFSDDKVVRIGYMIKESDAYKEYSVIYGFSIIESGFIWSALYFDDEADLAWAIETWKGIKLTE